MCLKRNRDLRPSYVQVLAGFLAITAGASSQAQQFPGYGGTPTTTGAFPTAV